MGCAYRLVIFWGYFLFVCLKFCSLLFYILYYIRITFLLEQNSRQSIKKCWFWKSLTVTEKQITTERSCWRFPHYCSILVITHPFRQIYFCTIELSQTTSATILLRQQSHILQIKPPYDYELCLKKILSWNQSIPDRLNDLSYAETKQRKEKTFSDVFNDLIVLKQGKLWHDRNTFQ